MTELASSVSSINLLGMLQVFPISLVKFDKYSWTGLLLMTF